MSNYVGKGQDWRITSGSVKSASLIEILLNPSDVTKSVKNWKRYNMVGVKNHFVNRLSKCHKSQKCQQGPLCVKSCLFNSMLNNHRWLIFIYQAVH